MVLGEDKIIFEKWNKANKKLGIYLLQDIINTLAADALVCLD